MTENGKIRIGVVTGWVVSTGVFVAYLVLHGMEHINVMVGLLGYGLLLIALQWKKVMNVLWPFLGAVVSMLMLVYHWPKAEGRKLIQWDEASTSAVYAVILVFFIVLYALNRNRW
jgi:hypothetical protein